MSSSSAVEITPEGGVVVRRSGKSPLRFQGSLVCEAQSIREDGSDGEIGCRLAVAARARGGYVAAIDIQDARALRAGGLRVAADGASLADAAQFFEDYNPASDMALRARALKGGPTAAGLMLAEVGLRQRIEAARRDYALAVGDMLERLSEIDTALAA